MNKDRIFAKITALENAAAFIENHGEEGGIEDDTFDFPVDLYLSEAKKVAKMLFREAEKVKYGVVYIGNSPD